MNEGREAKRKIVDIRLFFNEERNRLSCSFLWGFPKSRNELGMSLIVDLLILWMKEQKKMIWDLCQG